MTFDEVKQAAIERLERTKHLPTHKPMFAAAVESDEWGLQLCFGFTRREANDDAWKLACHNREFGRSGCRVVRWDDLLDEPI